MRDSLTPSAATKSFHRPPWMRLAWRNCSSLTVIGRLLMARYSNLPSQDGGDAEGVGDDRQGGADAQRRRKKARVGHKHVGMREHSAIGAEHRMGGVRAE